MVMNVVRKLARKHEVNPEVFEVMSPPNREPTTVNRIQKYAATKELEVERSSIVKVLKDLAAHGYGEFVVGRRGHRSRFCWGDYALKGDNQQSGGNEEDAEELGEATVTIGHRFMLRPTFEVEFVLPLDMTAKEAQRLATFVSALPFDPNTRG